MNLSEEMRTAAGEGAASVVIEGDEPRGRGGRRDAAEDVLEELLDAAGDHDGADNTDQEAVLLLRLVYQELREELVTHRERRKVSSELDTIRTCSRPTVV
jgi:hypothetical protein